ncbi:uncharacterized protein LOC122861436 [Siniperca chuatsi]|uniref:uncharacterized protein LOC122861436 n=1 Tax=Siniperca chuatsi TaxID=119488 RepID=UPI001CE225E6|nr:uncharacterized protein LOC122861436 [Siniperca chuatsi]XP_044021763.1 uncharacterized protein LOC122861436 [Siniperca chuatsi]XP_044021764.1 uncharacterized protein LOC122861436 [Siniperca chuatsi]
MGSTGSRPRQRKVAPSSLQEEGAQPKPQWTLPALPVAVEQQSGFQRKTILPPLKQEITLSTLSEPCFAGNLPLKQSNNSSIIHSHPPRRSQALQPLALQIGHTSTANQIAMSRDCRDGGVHRFSTTGQAGHSGTSRMIQGGFLEAQTALTQQTHQHRRAHLRQAREQRRHKVVYKINVGGPNTEGIQRLKLVRRPTERDIFWDETTGESLDPSCILDPISLPHLYDKSQRNQPNKHLLCTGEDGIQRDRAQGPRKREERTQQSGHRVLSLDKNLSWTNE